MGPILRLAAEEYDAMIASGAFDHLRRRIELIRGELREMNPAGPVHEDYVDFLNRWSVSSTDAAECVIRVQSSIDLVHSRPEPDIAWLKAGRYAQRRPQPSDVFLVIEVADSNVEPDLGEKAELYAEFNIPEYWVVDTQRKCVHVHRRSLGDCYQDISKFTASDSIAPLCKPSATLQLSELFSV